MRHVAGRRVQPGMHIATLNDMGKLEVDLSSSVASPAAHELRAEIGRIPVDSIYSPVLVTYKVDATRVE